MKETNEAIVTINSDLTLPIITVVADTLPEAWEKTVIAVWENGAEIKTQYDKDTDPPSKDATVIMTIKDPLMEPRIHRAFPGGIEDLEIYRQEVVDGIHDHWIDPENGKWEYTYHKRIFNYDELIYIPEWKDNLKQYTEKYFKENWFTIHAKNISIDQIEYVIDALTKAPFTRRAQAITWKPLQDCGIEDPACLQSLWFRIFNNELVMNVRMRSNDLFKATFMNLWAFIDLQKYVAKRVSENLGIEIKVGQLNHMVDSCHLYGSYNNEIEAFFKTLEKRTFKERVWNSQDEMVTMIITEAQEKIKLSLENEKINGRKGI